jgi:hypothetical protein
LANKAFLGIVFVRWEFYSQRPHNRRQGGFLCLGNGRYSMCHHAVAFNPCRLTGSKQGPLLIAQQQKEPTKKATKDHEKHCENKQC